MRAEELIREAIARNCIVPETVHSDRDTSMTFRNSPTEGVNTKSKRIARQMHGRASFTPLRQRILLG